MFPQTIAADFPSRVACSFLAPHLLLPHWSPGSTNCLEGKCNHYLLSQPLQSWLLQQPNPPKRAPILRLGMIYAVCVFVCLDFSFLPSHVNCDF